MKFTLLLAVSLAAFVVISDAQRSLTGDRRNSPIIPPGRFSRELTTCRIVGDDDSILLDKPDICPECQKCIASPKKILHESGNLATPYYCRRDEIGNLVYRSCLAKNMSDDTTIQQRQCRQTDQCSQGPVSLILCDGTDAELFFCQSIPTESEGQGSSPENEKRNIFTALMKHACSVIQVEDQTEHSQSNSCESCTAGPVYITKDDEEFELYFCDDEQERPKLSDRPGSGPRRQGSGPGGSRGTAGDPGGSSGTAGGGGGSRGTAGGRGGSRGTAGGRGGSRDTAGGRGGSRGIAGGRVGSRGTADGRGGGSRRPVRGRSGRPISG